MENIIDNPFFDNDEIMSSDSTATYFQCSSNYDIHALIDADDGLIVSYLGDSPDDILPGLTRADVNFDRHNIKLLKALRNLY